MTTPPTYYLSHEDLLALRECVKYVRTFGQPFTRPETVQLLPDLDDTLALILADSTNRGSALHVLTST